MVTTKRVPLSVPVVLIVVGIFLAVVPVMVYTVLEIKGVVPYWFYGPQLDPNFWPVSLPEKPLWFAWVQFLEPLLGGVLFCIGCVLLSMKPQKQA